jgi:hypothetical protein
MKNEGCQPIKSVTLGGQDEIRYGRVAVTAPKNRVRTGTSNTTQTTCRNLVGRGERRDGWGCKPVGILHSIRISTSSLGFAGESGTWVLKGMSARSQASSASRGGNGSYTAQHILVSEIQGCRCTVPSGRLYGCE